MNDDLSYGGFLLLAHAEHFYNYLMFLGWF